MLAVRKISPLWLVFAFQIDVCFLFI